MAPGKSALAELKNIPPKKVGVVLMDTGYERRRFFMRRKWNE